MQKSTFFIMVVTVFSLTIAMEQEQEIPDYQTVKMQAKETLLYYLSLDSVNDKQTREEVAYTLDRLFSDTQLSQPWEKVKKDEQVPEEKYTFAQLEEQVAQRYHLAKLDTLYRLCKKTANH